MSNPSQTLPLLAAILWRGPHEEKQGSLLSSLARQGPLPLPCLVPGRSGGHGPGTVVPAVSSSNPLTPTLVRTPGGPGVPTCHHVDSAGGAGGPGPPRRRASPSW